MAQPITYNRAYPITVSDTVDIVIPLPSGLNAQMGIWVGGAGVLVAVFEDGSTASFTCAAGTILPIRCKRVNSTSTTATLMLSLCQV